MKRRFLIGVFYFCILTLQAQDIKSDDFIDDIEYGKNLYENPHGISCKKCHGNRGEGMLIANYKHKGKSKKLFAPQINKLSFEEFSQKINNGKSVMPKYYLTDQEILAIYKYLTK